MLDTGSEINIMSAEYYNRMKSSVVLRRNEGLQLKALAGDALSVWGVVYLPVCIDGVALKSKVKFFVVNHLGENLPVPALVGFPFVTEHIRSTNWSDGTFVLNASPDQVHYFDSVGAIEVNAVVDRDERQTNAPSSMHRNVTLVKSVTIPPFSSVHFLAELPSGPVPAEPDKQLLLFEPNRAALQVRLLSSVDALVTDSYKRVKISIDNHTRRSRTCPAGMCVGTVSYASLASPQERRGLQTTASVRLVQSMADAENSDHDNEEKIEQDDDIIELFENVCVNLSGSVPTSLDERRHLVKVLLHNLKAFATHPKKTPTTPHSSLY
jgi:hypothetical protein